MLHLMSWLTGFAGGVWFQKLFHHRDAYGEGIVLLLCLLAWLMLYRELQERVIRLGRPKYKNS